MRLFALILYTTSSFLFLEVEIIYLVIFKLLSISWLYFKVFLKYLTVYCFIAGVPQSPLMLEFRLPLNNTFEKLQF